ncbi:MAG: hypothetical protein V3V10_00175 [Planctomycetota bacterium]
MTKSSSWFIALVLTCILGVETGAQGDKSTVVRRLGQSHRDSVTAMVYSPDGKFLATAGRYNVRLWNTKTNETFRIIDEPTFQNQGKILQFSPDGKSIATATNYGKKTVKIWQVDSGEVVCELKNKKFDINSVAFSPDRTHMVLATESKTIKLWNIKKKKAVKSFKGHKKPVNTVSFCPDGLTFATGSADKTVRIWSVGTGKKSKHLRGILTDYAV